MRLRCAPTQRRRFDCPAWQDRSVGPITIFDKSALQALNMDESVWFDVFFLANIVPVFYVETLADLEKEVAAGKTPEQVVGTIAAKTANL